MNERTLRSDGDNDIGAEIEELDHNTSVEHLIIKGGIDHVVILILSEVLKINTSLIKLNLWGNMIGDDGAQVIAKGLKNNFSLTWLDIGWNRIGDAGARPSPRPSRATRR